MRILIAEDEHDLNAVIAKKLNSDGYSTDCCYDGEQALEYLEAAKYDVVLMDVMMPVTDGFEAVRRMRAKGDMTPVIFLTARDSVTDKVRGLDTGGNDYIVKPFSFDELTARIRALTRRSSANPTNVYSVADLTLDSEKKRVTRAGQEIKLSAKEFALLEYLIRNRGKVLSRTQIENNIWNFDYEGGSNVVDVYIRYLRKKIDDGHDVKLIHTVRSSGYVLKTGEDS